MSCIIICVTSKMLLIIWQPCLTVNCTFQQSSNVYSRILSNFPREYYIPSGCICNLHLDPKLRLEVGERWWAGDSQRVRSPAPIVPAAARARRAMTRTLFALLALAALALAAAEPPRPRLIDFNPWSWIPTNRNKSPSIMDYFFPPSRTPKQTNLDPPADRQPPTVQTTIDDTPTLTTLQERERPTTLARKSHNKIKTTPSIRPTSSSPPKTKKSTQKIVATDTTVEAKTTQTSKTETLPPTTNILTSTAKPPKRYTIRPVRTTETPTVQVTESTVNTNSDSTETVAGIDTSGTTVDVTKDTAQTLTTVAETRPTDGTTSTGDDSTTFTDSTVTEPADSREGYLPLRDKPQQNNVKINEQTNKEVSNLRNDRALL